MPRRPRDDYDDEYDDDRPRRRRRAEDSDDGDDPLPARRGGSPGGSAPTVLLVLGGVFLAFLLLCAGGIALYIYRTEAREAEARRQVEAAAERAEEERQKAAERAQEDARKTTQRAQEAQAKRKREEDASDKGQATRMMEQFIAELKAERTDAAYKLTTPDYQKRVSPAEFRKAATAITSQDAWHLHMRADFHAPASGSTYTFDSFGGWVTVKVVVVKEGDKWLVDRFTATPPKTPHRPGAGGENTDKGKATKLAEQFVADLRADRPAAAYKLTTADYQKRVPASEFNKLAAVLTGPDVSHLHVRADFWAPDEGSTYTVEGTGPWGLAVKLTAVKDGDKWLVDRFSVTKPNGPAQRQEDEKKSDKGKATQAAEQFVTELKADRPEVAYKMTTDDFRNRVSLAELKKLAAVVTSPRAHPGWLQGDHWAAAAGTTYTFTVNLGLSGTARLTAVGENGKWLIDRFSITPLDLPGGPKRTP